MSIIINSCEYAIQQKLGEGGFGSVYQVYNKNDHEIYAIKIVSIKGQSEEDVKNVEKEAEIFSQFKNDNIVKYHDSFKNDKSFYIIMEYCDGSDLRKFIDEHHQKEESIKENIIYDILNQLCSGIKEIHEKNIVHRDLKPENIFMNKNFEIKIGDFSISKKLNPKKNYTITKRKAGSDYYIAPEILKKNEYNTKADIYSLGCIIYELFTLNVYYVDKIADDIRTIDEVIYKDTYIKWQELLDKLLQKEYNKRPNIDQIKEFILSISIIQNNKKIKENSENIIINDITPKKYLEKLLIDKDPSKLNINLILKIFDSFNLSEFDSDFIDNFKKLEFELIFRDKISDYLNKLFSKINNISDFDTIINLINIEDIKDKNKFLDLLNYKFEELIKKETISLNDEFLENKIKILAKLAIINYIYGKNEKKLDFLKINIKKLDKSLIYLIYHEIIILHINNKCIYAEKVKGNYNDEIIQYIFNEFTANLLDSRNIDIVIKLIVNFIDYLEKEKEKEKLNRYFKILMELLLFKKDEFFSNKRNLKIEILYKLYEKGKLKIIYDNEYLKSLYEQLDYIQKSLQGCITINKLKEFMENDESIIIQRLSLIRLIIDKYEPKEEYKKLKKKINEIEEIVNEFKYISDNINYIYQKPLQFI